MDTKTSKKRTNCNPGPGMAGRKQVQPGKTSRTARRYGTSAHQRPHAERPEPAPQHSLVPNIASAAVQRAHLDAALGLNLEGVGVHDAAQRGVEHASSPLPHIGLIQSSFGRHDVSQARAQIGGVGHDACESIGAEAYATGDRVAFRAEPDLPLAAHEAAHIVQQQGGVHLSAGVGRAGDEYEQHADRVADLVVAGKSAESALDSFTGGGSVGAAVQRKEYTDADNAHLVELLLRRSSEVANEHFEVFSAISEPTAADDDKLQMVCINAGSKIRHAMHSSALPDGRSARSKSLNHAASLAFGSAVDLLSLLDNDTRGATWLRESLAQLEEGLAASGWTPPDTMNEADKRVSRANAAGVEAFLTTDDAASLVSLSLQTAVFRIRYLLESGGTGDEEMDQAAMRLTAANADVHLRDAYWALDANFRTALERRKFADDIENASTAIGELVELANASNATPEDAYERLFEHEDELLAVVGKEPKNRYIERSLDVDAATIALTGEIRDGSTEEESLTYDNKEDALDAIEKYALHICDAYKEGVSAAERSATEPAPPKEESGWEFLVRVAINLALSATAGAVGSLVKDHVTARLMKTSWGSSDGKLTGIGGALVEAAKDGVKSVHKDVLKDAFDNFDPSSVPGAYSPRNVFFQGQIKMFRESKTDAIGSITMLRSDLRRYDLASLQALANAMSELGGDYSIVVMHQDRVLREWMNFKARLNAEDSLSAGSKRDAGLPSDDQLVRQSGAPAGFLSALVDVDKRLGTEPAMSLRSLSMGAEPAVVGFFKDENGSELVRDTDMNTIIRVAGTPVVLHLLPDSRAISLRETNSWGLAWLKALHSGDEYLDSKRELDQRTVEQLNEQYDDSAAMASAERIAAHALDVPLSELES